MPLTKIQSLGITDGTIVNADINASAAIAGTKFGAGTVLQVVQTFKTDTFSTTSATWVDVTGLSQSITPSSASNKILVISDVAMGSSDFNSYNFLFQTLRGSTAIGISTAGSSVNASGGANMYLLGGQYPYLFGNMKMFLDSPATTSSTTYKIQINKNDASGTIYINRKGADAATGAVSSITLMEIAG
jgi:hypothetical protein